MTAKQSALTVGAVLTVASLYLYSGVLIGRREAAPCRRLAEFDLAYNKLVDAIAPIAVAPSRSKEEEDWVHSAMEAAADAQETQDALIDECLGRVHVQSR